MENTFEKAGKLAGDIKEYLDTKLEAVKLEAAEKSSMVLANVLAAISVVVVLLFSFIFGGFALAYGLAAITGSIWLGFLIVSVLFLVIGILVWLGRTRLIQLPVMNALIKQLFKEDEED